MRRFLSLRFLLITWLLGLFVSGVLAQSGGQKSEITFFAPVSEVQLGETFPLKFSWKKANDGRGFGVDNIEIPGLENFYVRNSQEEVRLQSVNGKSGSLIKIEKLLEPRQVGTFTLGPISLPFYDQAGNQIQIQSKSVTIKVVERGQKTASSTNLTLPDQDEALIFSEENANPQRPNWLSEAVAQKWFWIQILSLLAFLGLGTWVLYLSFFRSPFGGEGADEIEERDIVLSVDALPEATDEAFWPKCQLWWFDYLRAQGILNPEKLTKREIHQMAQDSKLDDPALSQVLSLWERHKFSPESVEPVVMRKAMEQLSVSSDQ